MANNGYKSDRKPLKTLIAVPDKQFPSMLRIRFKEKGKTPSAVSGLYSSQRDAQKAIDDWTAGYTRDKIYPRAPTNDIPQRKVKTDGEEDSTS